MKNLHLYKKNIYSQNGEDGVILEIIDMFESLLKIKFDFIGIYMIYKFYY